MVRPKLNLAWYHTELYAHSRIFSEGVGFLLIELVGQA